MWATSSTIPESPAMLAIPSASINPSIKTTKAVWCVAKNLVIEKFWFFRYNPGEYGGSGNFFFSRCQERGLGLGFVWRSTAWQYYTVGSAFEQIRFFAGGGASAFQCRFRN